MSDDFDPFAEATPEEKAAVEDAKAKEPVKKEEEKLGKSTLVLAIKPADTEVDLKVLEEKVRKIERPGLLWGKSQTTEMCFGLFRLEMGAVVRDDVSVDELEEEIQSWEDLVSSTEIIAFQKI